MLYVIPDYYKEFKCTADRCEDTCCAGWQIMIDKKSLAKYKKVPGHFGKRLRHSINWKEGCFRQSKDKRCAFLNDDNLCDLYQALGEKSLCKTCSRYPRHVEEFENVREITLSVSCPEVARLLVRREEPVRFLSYQKDGEEEFESFDPFLYSVLADGREVLLRILQNRKLALEVRMMLTLGLARDMQRRVNRGEVFACEQLFARYESEAAAAFTEKKCLAITISKKYKLSKRMFRVLERLERLRDDWEPWLLEAEDILFSEGVTSYESIHREFERWLSASSFSWEILGEQLLVYLVFDYFCGAVYDGCVSAKAEMSVTSVFLIYEMLLARWVKNGKTLDDEDASEIICRFSREVEHSDENLKLAEREFTLWSVCAHRAALL